MILKPSNANELANLQGMPVEEPTCVVFPENWPHEFVFKWIAHKFGKNPAGVYNWDKRTFSFN